MHAPRHMTQLGLWRLLQDHASVMGASGRRMHVPRNMTQPCPRMIVETTLGPCLSHGSLRQENACVT